MQKPAFLITTAVLVSALAGLLLFMSDAVRVPSSTAALSSSADIRTQPESVVVPTLPFAENDPSECGIPRPWSRTHNQAWLTGIYNGELVQPDVLLYDSHLRREIVGSTASGSAVIVLLYQENPTLDYFYVRLNDGAEGWVPAPFVVFEPVSG